MNAKKDLVEKIKNLVICDKNALEKKEALETVKNAIEHNRKLILQLQSSTEEKKQTWQEQQKKVHRQEMYAQDLKEQEENKRKQLDSATNQKVYAALTKELKVLERNRLEQENTLMSCWNNLEKAENDLTKEKDQNTKKVEELTAEIQKQTETLSQMQATLEELEAKRLESIKEIPQEWLQKYERMKHHVADPIVQVISESCSACYYSVLQQDLYRLKKSGILPCRNCYRFLYYDQGEEQDNKKASF
ncbi:MAG: hypothetical protein V1855_02315 [bacterium]